MSLNIEEVEKSPELQRVLWACYEYWKNEPLPPHQREICFNWIIDPYRQKFGGVFHPSKLYWLTKYGFLIQSHSGRAGNRRYYKLVEPDKILALLRSWKFA